MNKLSGEAIKLIVFVSFGFLVLILVWWFIIERPARLEDEAAISRAENAIQRGDAKAAEMAIEEIGDLEDRQEMRDKLAQESLDAIRGEEAAGTIVDDSLYYATMRELCKSSAYRNDSECVAMRKADPREHSR